MPLIPSTRVTQLQRPAAWVTCVVLAGVLLRMLAAMRGHNYDVDSYRIVADIVANGGNVYAQTSRYNYGPVWFCILHFLDVLPGVAGDPAEDLRLKVAAFLTLIDVCIFWFLLRRYTFFVAALFFLSPIAIIITGYHSQFDNLAVLLALVSVAAYDKRRDNFSRWMCVLGIGASLCVKHLLFVFPIWLALKEKDWRGQLFFLTLPYAVFLLGFAFFLPEGLSGMVDNVFLYKSNNNAPLWGIIAPQMVQFFVPKIFLFVGSLLLIGLCLKAQSSLPSLHLYLVSLVTFSSAISNQALAIPVASISVLWNWPFALYSVVGGAYLAVDRNGLHLQAVQRLMDWRGYGGYAPLVMLLAVGLLVCLWKRRQARSIIQNGT